MKAQIAQISEATKRQFVNSISNFQVDLTQLIKLTAEAFFHEGVTDAL